MRFFAKSLPLFFNTKLNPAALPLLTLVAVALKVVSAMSALPVAGGAAAMVKFKVWVSDKPLPSVTLTLKLDVPAVVGVPPMTPAVLRDKPAGKLPAASDHV